MSGASAMHTKDIKARAAEWLERQDRADWSAQDQAELEAWLAESSANLIAYWRVHDAWKRAERLVAVHPVVTPLPVAPARRKIWPLLTSIAASAIAVAALGLGGRSLLSQPQDRTFATPVGGREIVSFADGSRIELNTSTVLRTRMTTQNRTVWLERGEAYFQVKHDEAHPFIVIAGGDRVTDLGTKFVMRRDSRQLEVALLEGRVRFGDDDSRPQAQTTLLMPGDVATASANAMFVTQQSVQSLAQKLSWRRGVLVFDKTPLADAAKEFNRYNRQKLVIADPAAASITIDGTFPTNNVEAFTDVALHILRLHVDHRGDNILISR